MHFRFKRPSDKKLKIFMQKHKNEAFSYEGAGLTAMGQAPKGYYDDRNDCLLGEGEACWQAACTALQAWQHFPQPWTEIYNPAIPFEEGAEVLVLFHLFGTTVLNGARIVYTINEENRFGYAYGTLPTHLEKGEELFMIERMLDGKVYYRLRSFSLPGHWWMYLGLPIVRYYQKKFVRDSFAQMRELVGG